MEMKHDYYLENVSSCGVLKQVSLNLHNLLRNLCILCDISVIVYVYVIIDFFLVIRSLFPSLAALSLVVILKKKQGLRSSQSLEERLTLSSYSFQTSRPFLPMWAEELVLGDLEATQDEEFSTSSIVTHTHHHKVSQHPGAPTPPALLYTRMVFKFIVN